jgi:hypothetical protein
MSELEIFYKKYPNSQHKNDADELLAIIRQRIADEKEQNKKPQPKQTEAAKKTDQVH